MSSLAGSFLVARHVLQDANFSQTVVLILKHGTEGAFGLVVNRPAQTAGIPFPVLSGGPCPMEGFIMLHGHADWIGDGPPAQSEVAPGIFLGDAACLARVTDPAPGQEMRVRVFSGYAGWGPDQLEGELQAGAWVVVPANAKLLFDTPAANLWDALAPPRIPRPSVN
jgi:putative transcriptional regulator